MCIKIKDLGNVALHFSSGVNLFENLSTKNVGNRFLDVKNVEVSEKTGPEAVERL